MKKTLLLFFALLCLGVSGAWAETTTITFHEINTQAYDGTYCKLSSNVLTTESGAGVAGAQFSCYIINKFSNPNNNRLVLKPQTKQTAYQCTFTAPSGYHITGYKIEARAYSASCPYYVDTNNSFSTETSTNVTYTDDATYTEITKDVTGEPTSSSFWIYSNNASSVDWLVLKTLILYVERDASSVDVSYTCENLSGQTLQSSKVVLASGGKFTPPSISGYSLDGVYDNTDEVFDYANTNIDSDITLKLKYHLTTNHLEINKSTVANPTWCTIRIGTGSGKEYLLPNESDVPFILFSGTTIDYPIADKYLWCIEGDETNGYMLYNKAKEQYLGRTDAYYGSTTTAYKLALVDDNLGNNPRWTFIYANGGYRLYSVTDNSHVNRSGTTPHYWTSGLGYNSNVVDDALTLYQTNYPYALILNTAGCVDGYSTTDVDAAKTAVSNTEPTTVDAYAAFVTPLTTKLTLTNGYYRIVSAVSRLNKSAAWYFNKSTDASHIIWSTDATTSSQQVNSLFRLDNVGEIWNIKSPNAQKNIMQDNAGWKGQTATLDDVAGEITISSLGSAQYSLKVKGSVQAIAAQNSLIESGHIDTESTSGTLNCWNFLTLGHSSTWYLMPVSSISIALNSDGAGTYYATLCLPFDVTISNATAYTLAKSGSWLVPTAVTDNKVPAGTAVLLKGTNETATATINTDAAFNSGSPLTCAITGTYTDKAVTKTDGINSDDYYLGIKSGVVGFYKWDGSTLGANRAYLPKAVAEAAVKGFSIRWADETGVEVIEHSPLTIDHEAGAMFDLSGRRVNKAQKGLYIQNGKKVMVK